MYGIDLESPMMQDANMSMHKEKIISLCNDIYGSAIRLKEIHLHTHSQSIHLLTDSAFDEFLEVFDELMEGVLGITDSKLELGSIRPNIPSSEDDTEILKMIRIKVNETKENLCSMLSGLEPVLDEFLSDLNKKIYLSRNR